MFYQTARHCLTSIAVLVAITATFGQTLTIPSNASLSRAYEETTYSRIDIADGTSIEDFAPGEIPLVTNRDMERYEVAEYFDVSGKYNVQTKCLTPEANRPGSLRAFALTRENGEGITFYDEEGKVVHTSEHSPRIKESISILEENYEEQKYFPSISFELNAEQLNETRAAGFEVSQNNRSIKLKRADLRMHIEPELHRSTFEGVDEATGNYFITTSQYEEDKSGAGSLRLLFTSTITQKTTKSGICYTEEEIVHRNYFKTEKETLRESLSELSLTWEKNREEQSPSILRLKVESESPNNTTPFQVNILDINGRPVLSFNSVINGQMIDVSGLSHGIYILSTTNGASIHSQVFTK